MGLTFVDEVKGGNIPKEFIPSVQKGFEAAMANGALAGYTMDSMKVTLKDGSFHPVDSDQLSFEIAARNGYRHAAPKARWSFWNRSCRWRCSLPRRAWATSSAT